MPSSRWKVRSPDIFPIRYSEAVLEAVKSDSEITLDIVNQRAEARQSLDKFRAWRHCLRENGSINHRCYSIERDQRIIARMVPTQLGIELRVRVIPRRDIIAMNPWLAEIVDPSMPADETI